MYGLKIAILGALAASVPALAQDDVASQLPQCGLACSAQSAQAAGCPLTDLKCACSNPTFLQTSASCQAANCTKDEQAKVLSVGVKICAPYGGIAGVSSGSQGAASPSGGAGTSASGTNTTTAAISAFTGAAASIRFGGLEAACTAAGLIAMWAAVMI